MPSTTASSQRVVEIDGSELSTDIDGQLESAVVVDRMAMPDTFTLIFRDPERTIVKDAGIEIGKKVKISTASLTGDGPEPLITGEVTSIEADYDALGTRAIVRGYDKSHRLAAGRKTATFQNVKYSDIVTQLAGDASLTPDVQETEGTLDFVLQANQSDLDFLYGIAREIGYELSVDDETLSFKKPPDSSEAPSAGPVDSDDPLQLRWGRNLLEFRARMSAVAQVTDVQVRGWDPTQKAVIIGDAQPAATNAELSLSATDLADKVGGQTLTVVDHPVDSQDAADKMANARGQQVASAGFEATAVAVGSPALKAGVAVYVSGVDPALEGKWVISGSRHEFGNGPYKTALEFTGRQDRSIHGLVSQGAGGSRDRFYGVAIGLVTDNNDPDKRARVKVRYPWLSDTAESYWARFMAPGAGKDAGVVWMPSVGDEVLVAFEHGDIGYPIVLGGLWNAQDTIPFEYDDLDQGTVTTFSLVSRKGHRLSFYESSSESKISLLTEGGTINVILDAQNKEVTISSQGKVTIDAQQDVEIKAGGSMTLQATGQMTIKGATVGIN